MYTRFERLSTGQATGGTGGLYSQESYAYDATSGNLSSKGGYALTYGDANHPHAATAYNGWTYGYDANGNMTTRSVGSSTYTLGYDSENRLTGVSGAATASFAYDGDGRQVLATVGGVTTVYIGDYYEWTSAGNTKYYFAGGQRVALRRTGYSANNGLSWLFTDHLGSTSLRVAGSGGSRLAELRFKAWGETRYTYGSLRTKFQFTGQRNETADIGLYFYNARWYDPSLNRWAQPDSIIPDSYKSADFDRYSYVRNNPLRYNDPSGHAGCTGDNWDDGPQCFKNGKPKNIHIPDWDPKFEEFLKASDRAAAQTAYINFKLHPSQFAEYYVNPRNAPEEYDALELFAEYSTLHTTADKLILNNIASIYGQDAAEGLMGAQLQNLEQQMSDGYDKNLPHVVGVSTSGVSTIAIITFGHGARHLAGLNLIQAEVEAAIEQSVNLSVSGASEIGSFWGRITIRGQIIEYRAYPVGNNIINIGTYYSPENK